MRLARGPSLAAPGRQGSPTSSCVCRMHSAALPRPAPCRWQSPGAGLPGGSGERGMPGRSWAVRRNQDKPPTRPNPWRWSGRGRPQPSIQILSCQAPPSPPGPQAGRGLGLREAWAAGRQSLRHPTGGSRAPGESGQSRQSTERHEGSLPPQTPTPDPHRGCPSVQGGLGNMSISHGL